MISNHPLQKIAAKIKLLSLDVDGILTDGRLLIGPNGEEYKSFNVKDGQGLKMLQRYGIKIAIISGRQSKAVEFRMSELGITQVFLGCKDKVPFLEKLLTNESLNLNEVGYMGDDLPDIPILKQVGLRATVSDCHPAVKPHVDFITKQPGGHGAVREVCDLIIGAHQHQE